MQRYERPNSAIYRITNDEIDDGNDGGEKSLGRGPVRITLVGTLMVLALVLLAAGALVLLARGRGELVAVTSAALRGDQTAQIADQPHPLPVRTTDNLYLTRSSVLCGATPQSSPNETLARERQDDDDSWQAVDLIAIDCENTGTNLHVYTFERCCGGGRLRLSGEHFHHTDRSLLEQSYRPHLIEHLISSLLEKAASLVAGKRDVPRPLIVLAPSELRNMSPYATAKILSRVKKTALRAGYPLGRGGLKVMKLGDKAANLWIATSFLTAENFEGRSPEELVVVELGEQDLRVARVVRGPDAVTKGDTVPSNASSRNKPKKKKNKAVNSQATQLEADPQQAISSNTSPISGQGRAGSSIKEASVVIPKMTLISNEESLGTAEMPSITPETPLIAGEALPVDPEAPLITPEAPIKSPEAPVKSPEAPLKIPDTSIEIAETLLKNAETPLKTPEAPLLTLETLRTTPEAPLKTPEAPLKTPVSPLKTPESPLKASEAPLKTPEERLKTSEARLITDETPLINTEGLLIRGGAPLMKGEGANEVTNEVSSSLPISLNQATQSIGGDKSKWTNKTFKRSEGESSLEAMDLTSLLKLIFWGEDSELSLFTMAEYDLDRNVRHKRRLSDNILAAELLVTESSGEEKEIDYQETSDGLLFEWGKLQYPTEGTVSNHTQFENHKCYVKGELCKRQDFSMPNCRNLLNALSTALNILLCVFRVTEHVEICNIISELCQHQSRETISNINEKLHRMNFSNRLEKRRQRFSGRKSVRMLKRAKSRKDQLDGINISRFYSRYSKDTIEFVSQEVNPGTEDGFGKQEGAHLNRRRGRRRVEDELMVQIAPRCMSQQQFTLSASNLPFGVYPARIAFLTYRLNIAKKIEKTPTRNWAKGTRSDVSPEEVYGMIFFDAAGEQSFNSSDSYHLGSTSNSHTNVFRASSNASTPTHVEGNNHQDSRANGEMRNSFGDTPEHSHTTNANENTVMNNFGRYFETSDGLLEHQAIRNQAEKTSTDENREILVPTSETDQSDFQMTEDPIIQTNLIAGQPGKDSAAPENDSIGGKKVSLTEEKYGRGAAAELGGRNKNRERKMQMDRRWMAETVAKLNRVVDSILKSIATGDIRVVEKKENGVAAAANDENNKNESALVKNVEVGGSSGSIDRPTPSLSLGLSNATSITGASNDNNKTEGRRPRKRRPKNKKKQPNRRRVPGRKRKKCERCSHRQSLHSNRTINLEKYTAAATTTIAEGNGKQRAPPSSKTPRTTERRAARRRTKRRVSQATTTSAKDVVSLKSPCLPRGSKGRLMLDGQEVTVIGSFNERHKQRCRNQVREIALSRINKPISGPDTEVVLTGAFYYIADSVGLMSGREGGRIKAGTFRKIADRVCAAPSYEDPLACLDYQWAASIVLHGLKIPPSHRVTVGETMNGIRITPVLGSAIAYLKDTYHAATAT